MQHSHLYKTDLVRTNRKVPKLNKTKLSKGAKQLTHKERKRQTKQSNHKQMNILRTDRKSAEEYNHNY